MAGSWGIMVTLVLAVGGSVLYSWSQHIETPCSEFEESFFRPTYEDARQQFRTRAAEFSHGSQPKVWHRAIPSNSSLTIDFMLVPASQKKLLVVVSGTHGETP